MSLAEQVVVLGGSWVEQRKQMGRSEILVCERPLSLDKEAVRAEIGNVNPFKISVRDNGKSRHMAAIRVGHGLIMWEVPRAELC